MNEILNLMRLDTSCTVHAKTWQISSFFIEKLINKAIEEEPSRVLIIDTKGNFAHKTELKSKCEVVSAIKLVYENKNFRDTDKPVYVDLSANKLTKSDLNIVLAKLSEYTGHLGKNKIFITSLDGWNSELIKLMNNMNITATIEINSAGIDPDESRYQNIIFDGFIYGQYKYNGLVKEFDLFDTKA